MSMQSNELEDDMLKKTILAASAAAAALLSAGALAHDNNPGRGWARGHAGHRHYAPHRIVVVPAPRVVYAPRPRVAYPVYRVVPLHPAPVYSAPGFSIRFDIPL
jgi:hypothetical protein